jgi:polyisoprenoid-binding protein YceI
MRIVRAAAIASVLALHACGGGVQQATMLRDSAAVTPESDDLGGTRWAIVPAKSRFDVVGVDAMGGHHVVRFDRWTGSIVTGRTTRVFIDIDMTSARGSSELKTRLLKYDLLDVEHFPKATLAATLRPSAKGGDEQSVEGNATIHGVEKGLRFRGTLQREGAHYRFIARFKISRDTFGIHAKASWDGLIKDDVHIYVDVLAREEHVTVEEVAPPAPGPSDEK